MYGGDISNSYKEYARQLEIHSHSDVAAVLREVDSALAPGSPSNFKLGQIKDFTSIASLGQAQGIAMDKVDGGTQYLKDEAADAFQKFAEKIVSRIDKINERSNQNNEN